MPSKTCGRIGSSGVGVGVGFMSGGRSGGVESQVLKARDLRVLHPQGAPGEHRVNRGGGDERDNRDERRVVFENKTAEHGDARSAQLEVLSLSLREGWRR